MQTQTNELLKGTWNLAAILDFWELYFKFCQQFNFIFEILEEIILNLPFLRGRGGRGREGGFLLVYGPYCFGQLNFLCTIRSWFPFSKLDLNQCQLFSVKYVFNRYLFNAPISQKRKICNFRKIITVWYFS